MKLRIAAVCLAVLLLLPLLVSCTSDAPDAPAAVTDCRDGVCEIPTYDDESGRQIYAVVSPVGYHDVENITQAPRLDTLAGKTIALVGGSFMAGVTHPELIKCLKEDYPDITVYSFAEVGAGGPFSVFGQSTQTVNFQNRLKELGVDAVISGNCGCGLCTVKESGSSIAAEYIGIPAVTVGAPTFVAQIHSTGVSRGVPVLRTAEYPGAFAAHSTEELIKNTRDTVYPKVVKALTSEITKAEIDLYKNEGKRPYDEIVYYGDFDEIQEFCRVNGWTDGLPVVPPTDEIVREYLRFTPLNAEEVLGTYPLAYRETTVYTVAVNAVMAGVPKEFMPLCVAFAQCLENSEWRRPLASTHGWSPYAWINGPVARQLGIDCAQGMISEENNKALGRFLDLAMLNLGGYYIKENRMGTFGYLTPWTFAEDEQACLSVGWDPYHVTLGYELNDNILTAASALAWGNNVTPATANAEQIMKLLAWDITEKQQNGLGNTNPQVYRTVLITGIVARDLASGYASKSLLEDALIENARRPLWMRAYANYWANTGSTQFDKRTLEAHVQKLLSDSDERAALTDTPEWLSGLTDDERIYTIATMRKGQTPILVTGDGDRNKFQVMPGGGYASVRILLPDNWDELIAPMGYAPLADFYLEKPAKIELPVSESAPASEAALPAENIQSVKTQPDGTYRTVASEEYLGDAYRMFLSSDGILHYRVTAAGETQSLPLTALGAAAKVIRTLPMNTSVTLSSGKVTEVTLRPAAKQRGDASALTKELLDGAALRVSVTVKQSKADGGVTPNDAVLVLSGSISEFDLDLGGTIEVRDGGTPDFLTLTGSTITLRGDAAPESFASVIVKLSDGSCRMMRIQKTADHNLRLTYILSQRKESK
ncbi:MAG: hypothetical protein IJU41_04365 [Clostridia bacterium]|nr:hypothetical protein [Clostridia bacterium]